MKQFILVALTKRLSCVPCGILKTACTSGDSEVLHLCMDFVNGVRGVVHSFDYIFMIVKSLGIIYSLRM